MDAHTQEPGHVFLDAEEFLKFAEKEIGGGRFDRETGKFERAKASSAGNDAPGADEAPEPEPEPEPSKLQLPDRFWNVRPWLGELRAYAWARRLDPDLLFGAVIARCAASLPPGTAFDNGIHSDRSSTNLLVAGIGGPGRGKSGALAAAGEIVVANPLTDVAAGSIGSGEGIPEAYMGLVEEGEGKKKKFIRKQVRHNAFLFLDEGESLFKITAQVSNCTLQTLRTGFIGATLGNMNASIERKRTVTDYLLGTFIGFQPRTAAPLLADHAGGTPQRFIFLKAGLRPAERPPACRPRIEVPTEPIQVQFPSSIRAEVSRLLDAREDLLDEREAAGDYDTPDWEAHAALVRCKLAALFCVIDHRQVVTTDDWEMSGIVAETSRRVRDWLIAVGDEAEADGRQKRLIERADGAALSAIAARESVGAMVAVANQIAAKALATGGISKSKARKAVWINRRHLFDAALDHAIADGVVAIDGARIVPGGAQP